MASGFVLILNMSLTASIIICLILLARLFLRKLPKIYSYVLWSVVLFRLLCPVSLSLPISILAPFSEASSQSSEATSTMEYISFQSRRPVSISMTDVVGNTALFPSDTDSAGQVKPTAAVTESNGNEFGANPTRESTPMTNTELILTICGWVWASGIAAISALTIYQHFRLKKLLATAWILRGNVYESEEIDTAFVMGVFSPKIYLPNGLPFDVQKAVLLHEQTHQARGDNIVKVIAYIALALHWFNPLVWLAYKLACDDMEKSCDEAVIRGMTKRGYDMKSVKYEYGKMLVAMGSGRWSLFSPVSFAENSTKGRVENIISVKTMRKRAAAVLAAALCVGLAGGVVNPIVSVRGADSNTSYRTVSFYYVSANGETYYSFPDDNTTPSYSGEPVSATYECYSFEDFREKLKKDVFSGSELQLDMFIYDAGYAQEFASNYIEEMESAVNAGYDETDAAAIVCLKKVAEKIDSFDLPENYPILFGADDSCIVCHDYAVRQLDAVMLDFFKAVKRLRISSRNRLDIVSLFPNVECVELTVEDDSELQSLGTLSDIPKLKGVVVRLALPEISADTDFSALSHISSLEACAIILELEINNVSVLDLSKLSELPNLRRLYTNVQRYDRLSTEDGSGSASYEERSIIIFPDAPGLVELDIVSGEGWASNFSQAVPKMDKLRVLNIIAYSGEKGFNEDSVSGDVTSVLLSSDNFYAFTKLKELISLNINANIELDWGKCKALSGLEKLERLNLIVDRIDDGSFVEDMKNLREFIIETRQKGQDGTSLYDKLESPTSLEAEIYSEQDLLSVSRLTTLKKLSLNIYSDVDVGVINNLSGLEELTIFCGSTNYKPNLLDCTNGMTELRSLYVNTRNNDYSFNAVLDTSALAGLPKLESLSLMCAVKDLNSLRKLPELKSLSISAQDYGSAIPVGDLGSIASPYVTDLELSGALRDVSFIANFPSLRNAKLMHLHTDDVSSLASLENLESVELHFDTDELYTQEARDTLTLVQSNNPDCTITVSTVRG